MILKSIITVTLLCYASGAISAPHPSGHHPGPRPVSIHHYHHRTPHNEWWVGPTIIGSSILGSAIINAYSAPKTVVIQQSPIQVPVIQQPVVIQPAPVVQVQKVQVWVPGCFVDQVQANGTIIRVWQEGHYEWC